MNSILFYRDAPVAHFLLLRRFLEEILQEDLRYFYAESCFKVSFKYSVQGWKVFLFCHSPLSHQNKCYSFQMFMTYTSVPKACQQQYLNGKVDNNIPDIVLVRCSVVVLALSSLSVG